MKEMYHNYKNYDNHNYRTREGTKKIGSHYIQQRVQLLYYPMIIYENSDYTHFINKIVQVGMGYKHFNLQKNCMKQLLIL